MSNQLTHEENEKIDKEMHKLIRIYQDILKRREIMYPDRRLAWNEIRKQVENWLNVLSSNLGTPDLPIDLLKDLIDVRNNK